MPDWDPEALDLPLDDWSPAVQQALRHCADPVWVFDIDDESMRWANPAALRFWRATDEHDLVGRNYASGMSQATRRRLDGYRSMFARGKKVPDQWTLFPAGEPTTVSTLAVGLTWTGGTQCMLFRVRPSDVTEVDLRGIEALRHTGVMITLCDLDGTVLMENPAAADAYGFSTGRVVGHGIAGRIASAARATEVMHKVEANGEYSGELQMRTRQGLVWHGIDILTTNDPATGRPAVVINEKNIHARKQSELALQAARAELETRVIERTAELQREHAFLSGVLETAAALVFVADADGRTVQSNRALRDFLGADPSASAMPAWELLGIGDASTFAQWMAEGTRLVDREVERHNAEGGRQVLYWNSQVLHVGEEREPYFVASGLDITERRELQMKLRLSDRVVSLGTLASGVAHELNNPLAYILTSVELAKEQLPCGDPDVAGHLDAAIDACHRVAKIVADLKGFSQPPGEVTAVHLRNVVDSAVRMSTNHVRHRAQLEVEVGDGLWVAGDETKLCQVVLNLLINAAQSIAEGDAASNRISVCARAAGRGVTLAVRDSGRGIDDAIVGRIFDPFFTTKPSQEGTGLGLAICHRIVTEAGGTIEVTSEVGRGTEFRVTLPAAEPRDHAVTSGTERLATPPATAATILIADDEPGLAEVFASALPGYTVEVATSGAEALEKAKTTRFDVVVCDLMMPDLNGAEVHAAFGQDDPRLAERMLFVTGGAFTDATRQFARQMGDRVLHKPVSARVLRASVARMLGAAPV